MPIETLYKDSETKMNKAVDALKREFSEIRGGRATPALVENVTVDYYGAPTPLKQLAAVTAPEPRMLVVQPWDASAVTSIEKAIQTAELGVTPAVDGKIVRLPIPPLSGERRDELVKMIHKMAEESRVAIRNVRRDANDAVKKLKSNNEATEDDVKDGQAKVQRITDQYIEQINDLLAAKEKELHST